MKNWPKMDEPATRSQMLAFASERDRALFEEAESDAATYPARLKHWEDMATKELTARVPALVEFMRVQAPYPIYGYGYGFEKGDEGLNAFLQGMSPPEKPSGNTAWRDQYKPAIAYLESLDEEDLTPTHRLILQRLGCSAD